jgi:F0F1-type ATP synthase assembly protein I
MVAPAAVGLWIDYHYDTLPWGTAIGAGLGFVGGFVHIFALLKRFEERDARKSDRDAK